jgi:predicted AlkP superfamily phosphohydrolase/phosphomutase
MLMAGMPPTIVIGLDGGNWPLIEQWISEGHLPNFERLVSEGASGVSRSYLPPVTCPNWKCYAAGKNPGKLGVYWWELIDTDERSMTLPDSRDFASPEIWDYLNDAGQRAGVINLPMSYPPRPIDGVMIAGGPRSRERRYTKPDELQSELEERFDYRVHPENVLTSNRNSQSEVEMIHDLLRVRMRAAKAMLEERDLSFLHLTLFHLNVLQHYFWNGPETKRAWHIIDEELEPFVDGEYNVVLMSDHGCTEIDTVFFVNEWLRRRGYLTMKRSLSSTLYDIGITQDRLAWLARTLRFEEFVRPFVPRAVIERFPSDEGVVREEKLNMVDWDSTAAIGSGQGLVYTVADNEAKRERILSSLEADLTSETSPNGRLIAEAIYRREDVYEGAYVDRAPDLVFEQRPGVHTSEAMGNAEVMAPPTNWRGENVPNGMVLFHGDSIEPQDLDPIRISDIAPTILHWMDLEVPEDMDGSVITDVFGEGTAAASRSIRTRSPLPERGDGAPRREPEKLSDEAAERLEDIGYLE